MPSARKPGGAPGRAKKTSPARPTSAKGRARRTAAPKPHASETAEASATPVVAGEAGGRETAPARRRAPGGKTITIVQYGSGIGCPKRQKRVLRSLGLRHPRHTVVRPDNPAVRGMVNAIRHLARIVEGGHGA
jgi:large subunit ribosomal protein L30